MIPKLLVIEDQPSMCDLLVEQLTDYQLVFACNKRDALLRLEDGPYDGVLLDLHLPVEPWDELAGGPGVGLSLLRLIRQRNLTRGTRRQPLPVVVMTAYGDSSRVPVEALVDCGANDYLAKPFEKAELLAALRRAVGGGGALLPAATPRRALEVRLAFDLERERVWIETLPALEGSAFELLNSLRAAYESDLDARRAPENYACVGGEALAGELLIRGASLRKRVARLRRTLREMFAEHLERKIGSSDVVENLPWSGYRLNPWTVRLLDMNEMPERGSAGRGLVP